MDTAHITSFSAVHIMCSRGQCTYINVPGSNLQSREHIKEILYFNTLTLWCLWLLLYDTSPQRRTLLCWTCSFHSLTSLYCWLLLSILLFVSSTNVCIKIYVNSLSTQEKLAKISSGCSGCSNKVVEFKALREMWLKVRK